MYHVTVWQSFASFNSSCGCFHIRILAAFDANWNVSEIERQLLFKISDTNRYDWSADNSINRKRMGEGVKPASAFSELKTRFQGLQARDSFLALLGILSNDVAIAAIWNFCPDWFCRSEIYRIGVKNLWWVKNPNVCFCSLSNLWISEIVMTQLQFIQSATLLRHFLFYLPWACTGIYCTGTKRISHNPSCHTEGF